MNAASARTGSGARFDGSSAAAGRGGVVLDGAPGIAKEDAVLLGGKSYELVGRPERMPMSVFRQARAVARKAAEYAARYESALRYSGLGLEAVINPDTEFRAGDEALDPLAAFYADNMEAIIDMTYALLRFALGEEQFARAEKELDGLDLLPFCELGMEVMSRYHNLCTPPGACQRLSPRRSPHPRARAPA